MNLFELLTGILPVSSAVLSVVAEGYDEKEVIELLEKLSAEKKEEMPDSKKTN